MEPPTSPSAHRFTIRAVPTAISLPIRQRVLRPTQTVAEMARPDDDAPTTTHFAAFDGATIVGTASMFFAGMTWPASFEPDATILDAAAKASGAMWQLRGMATIPEVRGHGAGAALLSRCIEHSEASGGRLFWCNARIVALGFYEKFGLTAFGPEFHIPHAGPHRVMFRVLKPANP